ncbi:MAG TPA: DUF3987 domain-containing protein, partial [Candidatus Binatus sp.]|nr:DUF3987 domain-containing protein [Candidatus Binatus sp.]
MQATLAGRKVRDVADNRTNLFLLALANSGAGKDWPRKLNTAVLNHVGLIDMLGGKFASGEGLQDALHVSPTMLFQTDEIDGLIRSISDDKSGRLEGVMSELLTMFSSSNVVFPMRRKAGDTPKVIDQPCLIVFGTAIPKQFYSAMNERMLENGLLARWLVVQAGNRGTRQKPRQIDPPQRVLETAKWWNDFRPGTGNLNNWHPVPVIVTADQNAERVIEDAGDECDFEYAKAEARGDTAAMAVLARVNELSRRLALLHAVSVNHQSPRIDSTAAMWGTQ